MPFKRISYVALTAILLGTGVCKGQHIESYGVFGGLNFPFTIDKGLQQDPRYIAKFTLRSTPIGFAYGYDMVGHGFVVTPSFTQIGQKYIINNTVGGDVGTREVQMNYISVPVALKIHLNDLSFFRLSMVAALNFDYLMKGQELVTHFASKQKYPAGVKVPTDPGYTVVYDGVFVPDINKQVYVASDKFKAFQLSAGVGFRSDFDFSENWSMNFDGRAVFGIFDPRKDSYINTLKAGSSTNPGPDIYGQRREVYLCATIGISRIFQIKQKFQPRTTTKPSGTNNPLRKPKKPSKKH